MVKRWGPTSGRTPLSSCRNTHTHTCLSKGWTVMITVTDVMETCIERQFGLNTVVSGGGRRPWPRVWRGRRPACHSTSESGAVWAGHNMIDGCVERVSPCGWCRGIVPYLFAVHIQWIMPETVQYVFYKASPVVIIRDELQLHCS